MCFTFSISESGELIQYLLVAGDRSRERLGGVERVLQKTWHDQVHNHLVSHSPRRIDLHRHKVWWTKGSSESLGDVERILQKTLLVSHLDDIILIMSADVGHNVAQMTQTHPHNFYVLLYSSDSPPAVTKQDFCAPEATDKKVPCRL